MALPMLCSRHRRGFPPADAHDIDAGGANRLFERAASNKRQNTDIISPCLQSWIHSRQMPLTTADIERTDQSKHVPRFLIPSLENGIGMIVRPAHHDIDANYALRLNRNSVQASPVLMFTFSKPRAAR